MKNLRDEVREILGEGRNDYYKENGSIDEATTEIFQAIEREVKVMVAKEKNHWEHHTDKFGVGVRAGMEAMECRLNELLGVKDE